MPEFYEQNLLIFPRTFGETYIDFEMTGETEGFIALGFAHDVQSNETGTIYDGLVAGVKDGDGYLGSYSFDLTEADGEKFTKNSEKRYQVNKKVTISQSAGGSSVKFA